MTTETFPCAVCCTAPAACTDGVFVSPCQAGASRETTFAVEDGEYVARISLFNARLRSGGGFLHYADPVDVTVDYGSGPVQIPVVDGLGGLDFCKPQGVTSVTITIGGVSLTTGNCPLETVPSLVGPECDCPQFFTGGDPAVVDDPAWAFSYGCIAAGECSPSNPLP